MFGAIAPRYDLLNHLLSLNIDRRWRRRAVDCLLESGPARGCYLDACAGTLDLALEIATRRGFRGEVIATDFSRPMLEHGRPKVRGRPIRTACADALVLPFADATFDGVTVGFGVRNLASLDAGLREFARVLRPGGRLVVLEFTVPARGPVRTLYMLYFLRILPWVGRMVSRHDSAYAYLPASVLEFPSPGVFAERMEFAGFRDVRWRTLTAGIAALHVGTRGA